MNKTERPEQAFLPAAPRPQFVHTGKRRRIDHLSKYARVRPGTLPHGLLNKAREYPLSHTPGSSSKGHAYRNAVFQALLNTPMFVNFTRMHQVRWSKPNQCPIKVHCLTCAMADLAYHYWRDDSLSERRQNVNGLCEKLWIACQKTFWPKSFSVSRVGPEDLDDEFFYPDTFLLHFLTEMRHQLECSPSEYQTFEKMFTVHTVRRWRCKQESFCGWFSPPYKWESSLYLNLSVSKPHPKARQTKILVGIQRALKVSNRLAARRGSTTIKSRCEKCQGLVESVIEIDNLPEILIVIRDIKELSSKDDPDIPFGDELSLRDLTSGNDNEIDPQGYELVSGVGELRYTPNVHRNYAFVRGAGDIQNRWFCIMDEEVVEKPLSELEKQQRSRADGGLVDVGSGLHPLCPEIFIYRRKDYDDHTRIIDSFPPDTPRNEVTQKRDVMSRSINDIFTQKIGRGLLKFKVKMAPDDPGPQDWIEVDLKLSYELDNKHYGIKTKDDQNFLAFQLQPLSAQGQQDFNAIMSPYDGRAIDRALKRSMSIYPANQAEGTKQMKEFAAQHGFLDPSTSSNPFAQFDYEEMEIDPENKFNSTASLGWSANAHTVMGKEVQKALNGILEYKYKPDTNKNEKAGTQKNRKAGKKVTERVIKVRTRRTWSGNRNQNNNNNNRKRGRHS